MKKAMLCVLSLFLTSGMLSQSQESAKTVYKDPNASVPDRVRDLLSKMTVEEKVAQLESGWTLPAFGSLKIPSVIDQDHVNEALAKKIAGNGLGTYAFLDEFLGMGTELNPRSGAQHRNLFQSWVLKNTRLGIPVLFHGEALHGAVTPGATSFPAAVALGSTWDPELLEKMFTTVALESRASGNALVLAPVLDLSRDPRYGRVEEMYSEDPYLVAQLGIAAVTGLQGSDNEHLDANHVFATAKHFVHAQPENGTNTGPADFSERTMRSVFLYPFEQVVKKAHIEAVMPSYNETGGGIPSSANPWLLKDVLRKEWGFSGLTVSDYTAVELLASQHHVASNNAAAGLLAFKSGMDMELPTTAGFPSLVAAVQAGKLSEKELDESVGRVLTAKFRAGLFEHPYVDENRAASRSRQQGSREACSSGSRRGNRPVAEQGQSPAPRPSKSEDPGGNWPQWQEDAARRVQRHPAILRLCCRRDSEESRRGCQSSVRRRLQDLRTRHRSESQLYVPLLRSKRGN